MYPAGVHSVSVSVWFDIVFKDAFGVAFGAALDPFFVFISAI